MVACAPKSGKGTKAVKVPKGGGEVMNSIGNSFNSVTPDTFGVAVMKRVSRPLFRITGNKDKSSLILARKFFNCAIF